MTHRILTPLKSLALAISLKAFSKRRRKDELEAVPEPIVWNAGRKPVHAIDDGWMFEPYQSAYAGEASALQSEMNRVSGALGNLRGVLSSLAAHAPVSDALDVSAPVNAVWTEDALFDGEPMAVQTGDITEDADLFLEVNTTEIKPDEYSQAA